MGKGGGSEVVWPAVSVPNTWVSVWRTRQVLLDRYFVPTAVLPTFLLMLCVFGLPLLFSFYLSFTG